MDTTLHTESDGSTMRLHLSGPLDIAAAATARSALLQACQDAIARELHFDLSGVQDCDSAGVQLLQATARWLQQTGRSGRVVACSDGFRRIATALGACDTQQLCGMAFSGSAA